MFQSGTVGTNGISIEIDLHKYWMKNSLYYQERWARPKYIARKVQLFQLIDAYIDRAPKRILDIGCGFAKTSDLFQKKYGSELYLLEGEQANSSGDRIGKYGDVDSFRYYLPIQTLKDAWDKQGMTYKFVDGSNPIVPSDVKFDLVYSWLSCGFHYPVSTYKQFIQDHTTDDSIIIMDVRAKSHQVINDPAYDIVKVVAADNKKRTLHIKFNS